MSQTVQVFTVIAGPQQGPDRLAGEAAAFAVTIAFLLIAGWVAHRRARDSTAPAAPRFARTAAAAFFFAGAIQLADAAFKIASEGRAPTQDEAVLVTVVAGSLLMPFIAFVEMMLEPLDPARRRSWLIAAAPGAGLLIGGMSLAVAWKLEFEAALAPLPMLRLVLAGAGAGLVWWSLLGPRGGPRLARLFE